MLWKRKKQIQLQQPWTFVSESSQQRYGDFPGGPMVRTWSFHGWGARVQSLVRKLRSHNPSREAPKKRQADRCSAAPRPFCSGCSKCGQERLCLGSLGQETSPKRPGCFSGGPGLSELRLPFLQGGSWFRPPSTLITQEKSFLRPPHPPPPALTTCRKPLS